jgi:hypothetical protein
MPFEAILCEVERLHDVSERLAALAELHPGVWQALMSISGSVRNTATVLGVLLATKMSKLA